MKKDLCKKLFSFICPLLLVLFSANTFATTLHEAVDYTLRTNPELQLDENTRMSSQWAVHGAAADFFPTIDFRGAIGPEETKSFSTGQEFKHQTRKELGLELRQLLFDGGAVNAEFMRNRAKTNADAYRVWGTAEGTALSVATTYLNVIYTQQLLRIAQKNLVAHQQIYKLVNQRSSEGVGRKADIDQARARLALAKANLDAAESNARDAKTAYFRVTNLEPRNLRLPKGVSSKALPKTKTSAIHMAVSNHPLLKSAKADVSEARAQHEAAHALYWPRIDAVLGFNRNQNIDGLSGDDFDQYAVVEANFNIFRGGKDYAKQKETTYQIEQAQDIKDRTYREVVENMRFSWIALTIAQQRLPSLLAHKIASAKTVIAYKQQFGIGKRTLLDLLNSENESFRASTNYTQGLEDVQLAKYRVLAAMGALVPYLGIKLPEEAAVPYQNDCMDCWFGGAPPVGIPANGHSHRSWPKK